MPSYEERSRLIKALSEQAYFDAEIKPNNNIQIGAKRGDTGRYKVIHSDGGVTGNGDKIFNASAPQDGFVRGNASGNAIALESRNISQVQAVPQQEDEAQTSNIIVLFLKDNKLYVGGDRAEPEQIYELNVGAYFVGTPKVNKTNDGYIATFVVVDGLQQLLCTVIDGELIEQELGGDYPFRELSTVQDGYSKGFNCTLLTASFGVSDVFNGSILPSYSVVIGQTEVLNGILKEVNVIQINTNVSGGGYEVIDKAISITAPFKTGSFVSHNFLAFSGVSATFAFNGDYGDTVVNAGDTIAFEAIVGSQSYFGEGIAEIIDGAVQFRTTVASFNVFFNLQTKTRLFAIRLRKQHPNLINQNGFFAGATANQLTTVYPLTFSVFSLAVDVLNGINLVASDGDSILNQQITVAVPSAPPTAYQYFVITSLLSLYFNSEEFIELTAWANYIFVTLPTSEYFGDPQIGFRSYLVAISLDRLSSLYATYNQETTEDELFLNGEKINFGDLYLPLTDPIFPDEDPKNGVHLFNFYSPNLTQNKIYTVTTFPDEESGDVDIAIAEIQDNAVSFSTQSVAYVGLTDEFKDFIVDASFLG